MGDVAADLATPDGRTGFDGECNLAIALIDYGMPWQEQTRLIGRALGLEAIADQAVSAVEAQFQAVRERHPEWAGRR